MSEHTQGRLQAVEHYSDAVSITDQHGFQIVNVSHMPVLLGYAEKLGISHWADRPGESFLELDPEDQSAIAHRLVACWNACEGFETETLETANFLDSAYAAEAREFELTLQRDQLLAAATRLAARGFFAPTSCADEATLADMASMRDAIAKAGGAQ